MSTVAIVGAGLAGARCAETLRASGFEGRVLLIGEEPHLPYERPALSKEFLAGRKPKLELRSAPFWSDRGIELLLGRRVQRIDVGGRSLQTGADTVRWDALVLATGAHARRLSADGVHHLRTLDDAVVLRDQLVPGRRLAVIGAGFVGLEVASTALTLGLDVVVVDALPVPLARVVGDDVGSRLAAKARDFGLGLFLGVGVERVAAGRIELANGTRLGADVVLAGIGAQPAGGLVGDGAVQVDAYGRTELPGVFACGDVAAWHRPSLGRHVRAEHWTTAAAQARTVAQTIVGGGDALDEPGYFWSDQLGLRLQRVGDDEPWDDVVVHEDADSFVARYLTREGRLVAALAANRPQEIAPLRLALAA